MISIKNTQGESNLDKSFSFSLYAVEVKCPIYYVSSCPKPKLDFFGKT